MGDVKLFRLCQSYINLTINIPEESGEELTEEDRKNETPVTEPQVKRVTRYKLSAD